MVPPGLSFNANTWPLLLQSHTRWAPNVSYEQELKALEMAENKWGTGVIYVKFRGL